MAGDAGFYFKTNPLTLETLRQNTSISTTLQSFPFWVIYCTQALQGSPEPPGVGLRVPPIAPPCWKGKAAKGRYQSLGPWPLLIILPRMRMGTLTSLRRKLGGQGLVKCGPVHRRPAPLRESWAPHHTTLDDLRPICSPHWKEARVPGMMGLTR